MLVGEPLFRIKGLRSAEDTITLARASRVLIVRLDDIGDVVLTSPLLRELRMNLPSAWITLVVRPEMLNLVELCPHVNEIITFDEAAHCAGSPLLRHYHALRVSSEHLWPRRFDLAISPRRGEDIHDSKSLVYWSGAQCRVAYSERVTEDNPPPTPYSDLLLSVAIEQAPPQHEVQSNLDILRQLGGEVRDDSLELWLSPQDQQFADNVYLQNGVKDDDLVIGISPGAGSRRRMWPLQRFIDMAAIMIEKYKARILVIGGKAEIPLGEAITASLGSSVINSTGRATLRQAAALLSQCTVLLGNDSGPMHLAAALGVAIVEVSCHSRLGSEAHPHSPTRFGPWQVPSAVLRPERPVPPCSTSCLSSEAHCIEGVTTQQVKLALEGLLEKHCRVHASSSGDK